MWRRPTSDERTWAMLCSPERVFGLFRSSIPFASVIGPLVVWLLKKDSSAFVDEHGKESINFQITMSICVCDHLGFVVQHRLYLHCYTLVRVIGCLDRGAGDCRGNQSQLNGEHFRYPLTIRLFVEPAVPNSEIRHLTSTPDTSPWPILAYSINDADRSATSARSRGRWS